jgi:hypothetical protein
LHFNGHELRLISLEPTRETRNEPYPLGTFTVAAALRHPNRSDNETGDWK